MENKIHDGETHPTEKTNNKRILCNDTQFNNADLSMFKLLVKMLVLVFAPVIFAIYICVMISKSVGGHIEPGSVQAWGSLFVIVLGSVGAMLFVYYIAKNNAIGNKFFYFILDQEEGLYFTHIGKGMTANYIKKQVPAGEKIKSGFSLLRIVLFFFYRSPGISLIGLSRMEAIFKINRKYCFAEELLMRCDLMQYSKKIAAVKRIKYFSKGCEAWIVTMSEGIENVNKMIIYRNTSNYDVLVNKLEELYTGKEIADYELSVKQMKQVKSNIYRRLGVICLSMFVLLVLLVLSYFMYMQANYNAEIYSPGVIKRIENILANRSKRRIIYIIYIIVFVWLTTFVKLIIDLKRTTNFKCVPVEVVEYNRAKRSITTIFYEYNYFASVRYNGELVRVGVSKKMWMRGKVDTAALVLRKNIPYCLVDR